MPWTTPETFTAGQTLTAASMNIVSENLTELAGIGSGAWTTYTPTIANLTQGNGTLVAKYAKAGRWTAFYVSFTLGSTSSVGGAAITVSLPVTAAAIGAGALWGQVVDTGTQNYPMFPIWASTTSLTLAAINAAGTYAVAAGLATTVPFTWGNTDVFYVGGLYEAAA
jgi:hypothetical protein